MKKLTAIILLLCILMGLMSACKRKRPTEDVTPTPNDPNKPTNTDPTVVVPTYKDYGRGTVDYEALFYVRPDIQSAIDSFDRISEAVTGNTKAPADIIAEIRSLESTLTNIKTMCALSEINYAKDSASEKWKNEHGYVGTYYPLLSQAVERLLVACAKSDYRETFERDYFGYSLEEYSDGGIYTDSVVALMQTEAELESKYSSLNHSNVEITYKRTGTDRIFKGTVDEVKAQLREYFANDDMSYASVLHLIENLYTQEFNKQATSIFVELVKVRRDIAAELGYSSYSELAYETMGYDYSPSDMISLLGDIREYFAPVASELDMEVFYNYFSTNYQPALKRVTLINTLYEVYSEMGGEYANAFSYMLQHGLYDISKKQENRFEGAFTTYIDKNASPFIFMTSSEFLRDYNTLSHEFGHFLDGYINYGSEESLAVMEISSQALELLTLLKIKGHIHTPEYKYLENLTIFSLINEVILTQGFYAAFEHAVYSLDGEITKDRLESVANEAFRAVYGDGVPKNISLSDVTVTHTMLYPFYVESYVTSALVSLDIFFAESTKTGALGEGLKLYEALINRGSEQLSFAERLEAAGLDSPFSDGKVKNTADIIYYYITGKKFYSEISDMNAA